MSNDKMREEFEAWALAGWPEIDLGRFTDGDYCGFTLQHCWKAWQASRAAIVVELPEYYEYDSPGEVIPVLRDVRESIEAHGLKVKP